MTSSKHKSWGHGKGKKERSPKRRARYEIHEAITNANKVRRLRRQLRKHPNDTQAQTILKERFGVKA